MFSLFRPLQGGGSASYPPGEGALLDEEERTQLARKLLLTTEWIVEAGQKHGQVRGTRVGEGGEGLGWWGGGFGGVVGLGGRGGLEWGGGV